MGCERSRLYKQSHLHRGRYVQVSLDSRDLCCPEAINLCPRGLQGEGTRDHLQIKIVHCLMNLATWTFFDGQCSLTHMATWLELRITTTLCRPGVRLSHSTCVIAHACVSDVLQLSRRFKSRKHVFASGIGPPRKNAQVSALVTWTLRGLVRTWGCQHKYLGIPAFGLFAALFCCAEPFVFLKGHG